MSGLCSQKKSNGLLSYFTRLDPPKRTLPSNSEGQTEDSGNFGSPPDTEVEIGRVAQLKIEEVEKEEVVVSGAKRKRSYTKRIRQSEGSSTRALRKRHQSDTNKNDSDSDFEQKETVKRPKRKFTSVPNGVKSISSYFSLSGGSQLSTECSDTKSPTKESVKDCKTSEDESAVVIIGCIDSANENDPVIIDECSSPESSGKKDNPEIVPIVEDTPTRRRSSRIQNIEERKERELEEKKREQETVNPKPTRPRKRLQICDSDSDKSVAVESEEESGESSDFIDDEDEEHFQKRRKGKRKSKKANGKIPLMFLTGKEREKELLRLKKEKEKKPLKNELDAETLAFLHSGVPDVVLKAQKQVEKKQEIDEYLNTVEFFPRISHTEMSILHNDADSGEKCFQERIVDSSIPSSISCTEFFASRKYKGISLTLDNGMFCCGNTSFARFNSKLDIEMPCDSLSSEMPWVEKFKVANKKDLVVDKNAFEKLEKWLKQWKTDIKDDGGTGRKEIKKRKKDSDSDFVTSEEEERDFMNKSVLLCGSTGCGKTTAVYVLAKHLGFYVVEVNFSSRRSGKEVMQSVEEATLSHRLESSESCLLLFKDIDLVYPEEDEGFHAAVAQLISSSCRPIVMTTQEPIYTPLDYKIEKKDPLRIYFNRPSSEEIVKKVLVPMCKSSVSSTAAIEDKLLVSGLDSLVRHLHCDIRLSINQAQFLYFDNFFSPQSIHKHCNVIENCIDLDFVCKTKAAKVVPEDTNVDKMKVIKDLDKLSKDLSLFGDLELIHSKYRNYDDHKDDFTSNLAINIREHLEQSSNILEHFPKNNISNDINRHDSFDTSFDYHRKLSLVNDDENLLNNQINVLSEELGSYCDDFDDWQSRACVRTIVKTNAVNAVGRSAKRNGRMAFYFNRLDKDVVNSICATFGFSEELEIAKIFAPS